MHTEFKFKNIKNFNTFSVDYFFVSEFCEQFVIYENLLL